MQVCSLSSLWFLACLFAGKFLWSLQGRQRGSVFVNCWSSEEKHHKQRISLGLTIMMAQNICLCNGYYLFACKGAVVQLCVPRYSMQGINHAYLLEKQLPMRVFIPKFCCELNDTKFWVEQGLGLCLHLCNASELHCKIEICRSVQVPVIGCFCTFYLALLTSS